MTACYSTAMIGLILILAKAVLAFVAAAVALSESRRERRPATVSRRGRHGSLLIPCRIPWQGKYLARKHGQGTWLKQLISCGIVAQSGAISGLKRRNFPGFFPGGREFARVGTTAITPTAQSRAAFIRL
jgi:hypothetical protein